MAKQVTIPVTTSDCIQYYIVEYKTTGDPGYTFNQQYFVQPIVLENLADTTSYDVRITPYCCDGTVGTPTTTTFDTTDVPAPTNFILAQVGATVEGDWDNMSVDSYEAQRADNVGFTVNLVDVYAGAPNAFVDPTPPAGLHYYRVRSVDGATASAWTVNSITVV